MDPELGIHPPKTVDSEIGEVSTTVAQFQAQLKDAKWQLD
jgi:hypothetical protein